MLTERGTFFGYHDLVVDMRGLLRMRALGYPAALPVAFVVAGSTPRGALTERSNPGKRP